MKKPELIIEDLIPQDRQVGATTEDLRELADDIHQNGLKYPILVVDGVVVDGLKRIEAFKLLGRARIPVLTPAHFGEATLFLKKVREGEGAPLTVRRAIEMAQDLEKSRQKFHRLRYSLRPTGKNEEGPSAGIPSRKLLAAALGFSESYTEVLTMILKQASDPEVAKRIEGIKEGVEAVHPTWHWISRRREVERNPVASVEEVRATIARGFHSLGTTIEAMRKFGPMEVLTLAERHNILDRLKKTRTDLTRQIRELQESITKEEREIEGIE